MSFTLHQMNVFACVAKHRSFTKAAEELYMTQPAVSIQVKKLQENFGIVLFELIGRQLYLTDAGIELFETQKRIMGELDTLEMKLSEFKGALKGNLKIAVVSTAKYFMPYVLGAFRKKNNQVSISLKVTSRTELIDSLKNNKYDFAVVSQLPTDLNVQVHEFLTNPLYIAAHPSHPLTKKSQIPFKELKKEEFVIREQGSGTRMVLERLLDKHGIKPPIVMELSTNEAVKQAIMAEIGISLISNYSMPLERKSGQIQVLDIVDFPYLNSWKIIYLKGKKLSPVARNFLEFITTSNIEELLVR